MISISSIFLHKVDRIEAFMTVMGLILLVNNVGQQLLREGLTNNDECIVNLNGQKSKRPTLKLAFQLMRKIVSVKIKMNGRTFEEIKGMSEINKKIINSFGELAKNIYGFQKVLI